MTKSILSILLLFILGLQQTNSPKVIHMAELKTLITPLEKKVHVINFWATWCRPCIEELPDFEAIHQELDKKAKVSLISLDPASKAESHVGPFLKKKEITADSYLLDEVDFDAWIPIVDSSWSGALPATLIIFPSGKKVFHEGKYSKEELERIILK